MQKSNIFLERLDVRSLRTLKVLLETRSVTKAGEAMAISQPSFRALSALGTTSQTRTATPHKDRKGAF
jgi:hypothetical protein